MAGRVWGSSEKYFSVVQMPVLTVGISLWVSYAFYTSKEKKVFMRKSSETDRFMCTNRTKRGRSKMLSHWKLQWVSPSWKLGTLPPTGGGRE